MKEFTGYDEDAPLNEEEIIDEFLGDNVRASELRLMRGALEQRRHTFARERDRTQNDKERAALTAKLKELEKQIAVLQEEEAVTTFVEDSVRVTLHKPSLEDLEEE